MLPSHGKSTVPYSANSLLHASPVSQTIQNLLMIFGRNVPANIQNRPLGCATSPFDFVTNGLPFRSSLSVLGCQYNWQLRLKYWFTWGFLTQNNFIPPKVLLRIKVFFKPPCIQISCQFCHKNMLRKMTSVHILPVRCTLKLFQFFWHTWTSCWRH